MQTVIEPITTSPKREKFRFKGIKSWIHSTYQSNRHYSSENYYTYYVRTCWFGKVTTKKVTVYLIEID